MSEQVVATQFPSAYYNSLTPVTLLNPKLASIVTSVSTATRISLRLASIIAEAFLESLKYGTATSMDLSKRMLISAISAARIHHSSRMYNEYEIRDSISQAYYQTLDNYTNLGIYLINNTFSLAELFIHTGLHLTSKTVKTGICAAEESVRIIDGLFGSTDTSRALASIISLVRREVYEDDEFHLAKLGNVVVLRAITKAMIAFACLQNVTHMRSIGTRTLLMNVSRFIRYASASYGKNFMKILGIGVLDDILHQDSRHHPNHYSFARHTSLPLESILLSSFTNISSLSSHRLHSLVHYVAVDHSAQAIVLTCRGTLGLSDILTDLTCDYAELHVWGKSYLAHAGMLQSARILASSRSEVYQTIRQALLDHPGYGLVLCGHSLGGGVAALLSILWSVKTSICPTTKTKRFATSEESGLPIGRPIHCFAYGVPCVVSLNLSKECSGLITSVVNRYDLVPCLSLGLLKDFKNIAMSLYEESHIADLVISSVLAINSGYRSKEQGNAENNQPQDLAAKQQALTLDPLAGDPDRDWFWSLIKTMRADMASEKLYPPGALYLLDTKSTLSEQGSRPAVPATRVTMHLCENVEERFSEITFSKSMFMDHSPRCYEDTLALLAREACETI
ncbi:alpha/beta-hydrolase [Basidiobolus meristosporus CBS 931.73]|uniref:sn-1-specific diacylglycerol lipase n=1 Tax=Basidiobolus meristosporus CBS 931.73 TaxID=1314790 RepID=A0A1Y1Z3Z1_9FUNG|nr:alpha/beta-hydrolase [Basidiobolus meristosporus CBS 931.73]|eukprot:ORY04926.1 alpha/beta-hydrolase [Basidiobolus meristosporus CBS 931.73]